MIQCHQCNVTVTLTAGLTNARVLGFCVVSSVRQTFLVVETTITGSRTSRCRNLRQTVSFQKKTKKRVVNQVRIITTLKNLCILTDISGQQQKLTKIFWRHYSLHSRLWRTRKYTKWTCVKIDLKQESLQLLINKEITPISSACYSSFLLYQHELCETLEKTGKVGNVDCLRISTFLISRQIARIKKCGTK